MKAVKSVRSLSPGMVAALLVGLFAFGASLVINRTVFERLPHLEDEFAYLYQAKIFARGQAYVLRNEPIKQLWQPFVIQPETSPDGILRRFGKYTPGWPLLLAMGVAVGQPWVVNAFLSMLSVLFVYRMAREIFDEAVGLASALLMAISPMVLLLNASLMNHTSALFMSILFVYGYWRTTHHGKRRYVWAALAGLALGWVLITRPLSAVAIGAPVALHALSRLLDVLGAPRRKPGLLPTLSVLIVLALFVLPTTLLWPLFNHIWTGDWRTNTYTLLWEYDRVGFGPGYGLMAGGHTLTYGWRNMRTDMEVWLRDLFGWTLDSGIANYLKDNVGWGAGVGLSWIPVVIGLVAGRKNEWIWLFFELFIAIVIGGLAYWIGSVVNGAAAYSLRYYYEATFGVCIVAGYGVVVWARSLKSGQPSSAIGHQPSAVSRQPAGVSAGTAGVAIDYLNGPVDGRAALSARTARRPGFVARLQLAWEALWPGYILLLVACAASLAGYTPARFKEPLPPDWPGGLFHYNKVGQYQLEAIQAMRDKSEAPKEPVLIVVLHSPISSVEDNWRDYGAAMAVTSPYLDSDIIVVRVFEPEDAPDVVKRFPGRLVLYQIGENLYNSAEEALAKERAGGKSS